MADRELTEALAKLVRENAARSELPNYRQVTGLSQAILSGVGIQKPYTPAPQNSAPDVRGSSFVNRVLDIMSRPLYATSNAVKGALERSKNEGVEGVVKEGARMLSPITNPDMLNDMWEGFSGREKTTGRDLLKQIGADEELPGPAKFAAGLGLDIALDPLTYAGVGLIPRIGKAAKTSTETLRTVEEGTEQTAKTLTEQISERAAQQSINNRYVTPTKGMPAPAPESPPRLFQAGPGPDVSIEPYIPRAVKVDDEPTELLNLTGLETALKQPASRRAISSAPARPEVPPLQQLVEIQEQIKAAKSPVTKNILRMQAEKINQGVKPADVLSEARVTPPDFPEVTIGRRWQEEALEVANRFMKNNRLKNINHIGQSNLYNSILHAARKVRKDRRAFHVFQMLRVAEDGLIKQGRVLTDAEGISVRLSDVANISGGPRALNTNLVDAFRKARPSQQIEDLKAYTTPQVVAEILDPVIKTGADIADATKNLPPSQTVMLGGELSKELAKIAEAAGASTKEAKTAKEFIDELFDPKRDGLYTAVQKEARNLVRQSSDGILNPQTMAKISDETYKALGENPKVLGRQVNQTRVVEGIMTKFATWWGAKDLKPFSREYIDTARNVAAAFAETMTPLVRATKPSQREAAWAVATGKRAATTPQEQQLADQFKYLVERLLGTHGITSNAEAVLLRSGTMKNEINKELPKFLQFVETKGTDKLGRKYDYTNGQWMHSWKEWDVKEPSEALYQLTRSLQLVTRKNAMWDDAAARWGMPMKGAEFQHQANGIERLRGTYFPRQIADQLSNLQRQLDRDVFKVPHKAIEIFDKVQRMWKTGVTIYSPSHHIRNLNGDIFLAALDGVVSIRPYTIATKVLHAYPTRYKDLESVFNIMDPKLRDMAIRSRPGNVVLTTKRGEKVTAEQLYQAAESQGLFIRAAHIEDLLGDAAPTGGTFGQKFQPLGGRVYGAATRVSELRDHWVRLAHFADIISKSKQPLRVAIEQAGRRVKKFHPDGMDLTGFEQNVLRRIIPFYSWMRKATPLVIEGAVMRPHITLAFPKAMANMQLATGIESEGPGDPFPMDQMFPDWLKEKGVGPVLNPGSGLGRDENWRGEAPGYTIINPTNPFLDQIQQIGSPAKTATSSLTPAARIPIELLMGQTTLGIPLENIEGGTPGHLAQQIPAVGIGARLTGATRDNEPWNPEQLINWITSAGITGTGPYQAQAQVEIRQELARIAKERRGDYR